LSPTVIIIKIEAFITSQIEQRGKIMKGLITLTHLLFSVFIGMIIGGLIFGSKATWVAGIILLIVDMVIGMILQYFYDRSWHDGWGD